MVNQQFTARRGFAKTLFLFVERVLFQMLN
jgi:hypothetical protein